MSNLNEQAKRYFTSEMDITVGEFRAEIKRVTALAAIVPELVEDGAAYAKERWVFSPSWGSVEDSERADAALEKLEETVDKARALLAQEADHD